MTTENINILTYPQKLWLKIFMGLGVLTFAISVFTDPTRAWLNLLLSGYFLTGIGFCGMMMVAIHYVSNSGWDVVIRPCAGSYVFSITHWLCGLCFCLFFGYVTISY